jgi:hypothetical protein
MRPPTVDPTAGERAREIRAHPGARRRIPDPTAARYGELLPDSGELASDAPRTPDPTNPEYGRPHA